MSRSARIANFVSFRLIEMRLLSCYIPFRLILISFLKMKSQARTVLMNRNLAGRALIVLVVRFLGNRGMRMGNRVRGQ